MRKPSQEKTPGAQATVNAILHAAQGKGQGKQKVNLKGVIAFVRATKLTITLDDGSSASVILNADTRIIIPTLSKSATPSDLLSGMQVHVRAQKDDASVLTALAVNAIPGKPTKVHRVGVVTDYQPGISITIESKDGNLYNFVLTTDTKILPADRANLLKVGSRVTIISPREVAGGQSIAAGIVIHPENTASGETNPSETPELVESPTP